MDLYHHSFKTIRTSWGIAIEIVGGFVRRSCFSEQIDLISILPGLWVCLSDNFNLKDNEIDLLWDGLRRIGNLILDSTPYPHDTLVVVREINFNPCDYQPDGLSVSMAKWAAYVFNFEMPSINVTFDKNQNKYFFDWGKVRIAS